MSTEQDRERNILGMASDIRFVDGGHSLGAAALAEELVDLGYGKRAPAPAPDVQELIADAREWPRDGINEGRLINALADALEAALGVNEQ